MAKPIALSQLLMLLAMAGPAWGQQRIRLPESSATWQSTSDDGGSSGATLVPVQTTPGPTYGGAPSAALGTPTFDPYSTNPGAASTPPSLTSPPPATGGSGIPSPYWQTPGTAPPTQTPYGYPDTGCGPNGYPQQPPVLFPYGMNSGMNAQGMSWPRPEAGRHMRLFQDVRLRYSWLHGNNAIDQLDINDIEFGTTINFPNFLWSGRPIHVSPIFALHLWDGPDDVIPGFPSLPSRAYSAYAGFRWDPMLTPQFGGELDFSMGIFSDFSTVTSDSWRIVGTGVFVLNLTPTVTLKGGIAYLDRVDISMLPAGGILWQPNPRARYDIFFPTPKLSRFLWTVGNTDVWWYVNGEYGGGSWTVERPPIVPIPDRRIDINDIRIGLGMEWTQQNGLNAFFEVAYVFEREIVYASGSPVPTTPLRDTVMLRGGLVY